MNVARSTIKLFLANAGGVVVKFAGIFVFARELGPELIGVFFLFQAIAGLLHRFGDFDISDATAKRISEGGPGPELFSAAVVLKLVVVTAVVVGIVVLRPVINGYLGAPLALLLALQVTLDQFTKLTMDVLRGDLRVEKTALPLLARHVVFVGVGIGLVFNGFGLTGIIYGLLAGSVVRFLWGVYLVPFCLVRPKIEHLSSLFQFFKFSFVSSVGSYMFNWTDVLIIGLFLTKADVGVYEIPWRVTALAMLLSGALARSILPQMSVWEEGDKTDRIESLVTGSISVSLYLVVPAFFGTVLFAREILALGFGTEFTVGWAVLIVVMGQRVVEAIDKVLKESLNAINRPSLTARSELLALGSNVLLNVVLVWTYGIVGAAVATIVSACLKAALNGWYLDQHVTLTLPYRRIAGMVVASAGMTAVLWFLRVTVPVETLPQLLALVGTGALVYAVISVAIRPLRTMLVESTQQLFASS